MFPWRYLKFWLPDDGLKLLLFVDRVIGQRARLFAYALESTGDANVSGGGAISGWWLPFFEPLLLGPNGGEFRTASDFDSVFESAIDAGCLITPIYPAVTLPLGNGVEEGAVLRMSIQSIPDLFFAPGRESGGDNVLEPDVPFEVSANETRAFRDWQRTLQESSIG